MEKVTGNFDGDAKMLAVPLRQALRIARAKEEAADDPERYPNGRFARLYDPEGKPIELWQPVGRDSTE